MLGHLKLLAHTTGASERLGGPRSLSRRRTVLLTRRTAAVFRREPVWKVSMSVGLRPSTRCAFDEQQGVLRVSLVEPVRNEDGVAVAGQQQVVVYALKVRFVISVIVRARLIDIPSVTEGSDPPRRVRDIRPHGHGVSTSQSVTCQRAELPYSTPSRH